MATIVQLVMVSSSSASGREGGRGSGCSLVLSCAGQARAGPGQQGQGLGPGTPLWMPGVCAAHLTGGPGAIYDPGPRVNTGS